MSVQELVDNYKAAYDRYVETSRQAESFGVAKLDAERKRLAAAVAASLAYDLPYRWDEGRVIVKRRKFPFGGRLEIVPGDGSSPAAPPAPAPWADVARTAVPWVGAAAIAYALAGNIEGCDWKLPLPVNPDAPSGSALDKAGRAYLKSFGLAAGQSFERSGQAVKAGADLATAQAEHVAAVRKAVQPPDGDALVVELEKILPAGTDPKTLAGAKRDAYGQAMIDYGRAIQAAAAGIK